VRGTAVTSVGAAADLALAAHPGVSRPSLLGDAVAPVDIGLGAPAGDGSAPPLHALGLGVVPSEEWLAANSVRTLVLRA
jgi:hypothetical protein